MIVYVDICLFNVFAAQARHEMIKSRLKYHGNNPWYFLWHHGNNSWKLPWKVPWK